MATATAARVTAVNYDTGSQDLSIAGIRQVRVSGRRSVVRGRSDGEIGNTSVDVTGIEVTGELIFDDLTAALAVQGVTNSPANLVVTVTKGGGASGTMTLDNVVLLGVRQSPISANPDGVSPTFTVPFRGVFASADDGFDDFFTFA